MYWENNALISFPYYFKDAFLQRKSDYKGNIAVRVNNRFIQNYGNLRNKEKTLLDIRKANEAVTKVI